MNQLLVSLSLLLLANIPSLYATDIYMGGDIMLSRTVGANIKQSGTSYVFEKYNPVESVKDSSVLLFNLESPFSNPDKDTNERTFSFGANPKNVEVLNQLRGNRRMILSLANNHILNSGFNGLELTLKTLDENNLPYVGVSKNQRDPYIVFYKGLQKYCINSYTYDGKTYKNGSDTWYVNNISQTVDDLKAMKDGGCDFTIMMLHWGNEYKTTPSQEQVSLAHKLSENGLDLLVGSHSHILGQIEQYKSTTILYSLGNFIFDQKWGNSGCQKGMDCIYDEKLQRKIVPTDIGTLVKYSTLTKEYSLTQFRINYGQLTK